MSKRKFQLARLDSGPDAGKIALCAGDVTLGTIGKKFELRKLKNGIGVFANGEMVGTLDEGSLRLVNWPLDNDDDKNDDNARESPTDIGTRLHVKKIKEQHLTEAFRPGMSVATVARQFGYSLAEDGTFMRWTDAGVDKIKIVGDGGWRQQSAGVLQPTTGSSPQELWEHLDFIDMPAETHTGPQLTKYLNRTLFPKVQNLSEPLAAAILEYAVENKCSDFAECLREVTTANPRLWEKHKEMQTIALLEE